jgi:hypothetical protein
MQRGFNVSLEPNGVGASTSTQFIATLYTTPEEFWFGDVDMVAYAEYSVIYRGNPPCIDGEDTPGSGGVKEVAGSRFQGPVRRPLGLRSRRK